MAGVGQLLLLSATSSLDNFVVGVTLGMAGARDPTRLNGIVAAANAVGAAASTSVGAFLGDRAPAAAGAVAGLVFLGLGVGEARGYAADEPSRLSGLALTGSAWALALPMTLNNVAGGVAGGLAGFPARATGGAAFVASFGLMALGYRCGALGAAAARADPRLVAAAVFLSMGLAQLASAAKGGGT